MWAHGFGSFGVLFETETPRGHVTEEPERVWTTPEGIVLFSNIAYVISGVMRLEVTSLVLEPTPTFCCPQHLSGPHLVGFKYVRGTADVVQTFKMPLGSSAYWVVHERDVDHLCFRSGEVFLMERRHRVSELDIEEVASLGSDSERFNHFMGRLIPANQRYLAHW